MLKSISTVVASVAALTAITMTPAAAAPKTPVISEELASLVPDQGPTVVEHRRYYRGYYVVSGYGYQSCYWGWRHGYKVWICR